MSRSLVTRARAHTRMHARIVDSVRVPLAASLVALAALAGCSTGRPPAGRSLTEACPPPPAEQIEVEVHRRAETERAAQLARTVESLRADLAQAEEALVIAESGLRGNHSRADAVSSLAEARIQVQRASDRAPWRGPAIEEARAKLEEAARQIEEGHYGSALFFVYRAERIAENVEIEAQRVHGQPGVQFVEATRINMRSGPSTNDRVLRTLKHGTPVFAERDHDGWTLVRASTGDVGWVHRSLLRK